MKKILLIITFMGSFNLCKSQSITDSLSKYINSDTTHKSLYFKTNESFKQYEIDFSKVKTFDELKKVLQSIGFVMFRSDTEQYRKLKPYLKETTN